MGLTVQHFLFDTPIYSKIDLSGDNLGFLDVLLDSPKAKIEGYNPIRKVETTFLIIQPKGHIQNYINAYGGFQELKIQCKRHADIFYFYIHWDPSTNILIKVGQYPSVADFHIHEIKQYNKLLSTEKMKEFTRAMGLAANGVGIGSFVYLRRIFEYLIQEAKTIAIKEEKLDETKFASAHMDEKIPLLANYLPSFLIENKSIYSILSKGIHELTEDECLAYFDPLKVGIEIILDEKLEEQKKAKKIEDAKKKINKLNSEVKRVSKPI